MNYQEINEKMLPQFIHMLSNLKLMLEKAAAHADQKKFDVNTFWTMKLAPDMFPLGKQIQISCDTAKFFAARLSGLN